MYIWPNGSVTGSVLVAALDKFREALHAGESLEPWAKHIPDGVDPASYKPDAFPLPEKPADEPEPTPEPPAEPEKPAEPAKPAARGKTQAKE